MKENPLREKSYDFALKVVATDNALQEGHREVVLSTPQFRSGATIGANAKEAIRAQLRHDFLSKVSVAYKEANETYSWLRLQRDSKTLDIEKANMLIGDSEELIKLMGTIISSTEKSVNEKKVNDQLTMGNDQFTEN